MRSMAIVAGLALMLVCRLAEAACLWTELKASNTYI